MSSSAARNKARGFASKRARAAKQKAKPQPVQQRTRKAKEFCVLLQIFDGAEWCTLRTLDQHNSRSASVARLEAKVQMDRWYLCGYFGDNPQMRIVGSA